MCTDGFVFDVAIMFAKGYGSLAGQAYEPPSDSEAGAIATMGRTLRSYVEGKATTKELETAIEAVERLTGHKVLAFLSDHAVDPDYAVEVFILEPGLTREGDPN